MFKTLLLDRRWLIPAIVLAGSFHLVAQAPSPVSVSPASGTGSQQLFTFTFTDPVSWTHIQSAQVIAGGVFGQASSCYLYLSGNFAYLADDSGTFHNPVTFGSAATIENSRCILDAGSSSMTGSGTTWTVNLSLLFKSAAAGSYSTMMEVNNGIESGWAQRGSWTVTNNLGLTAVSVSPSSGTGAQQTFGFSFVDPAGWTDIQSAQFLVGPLQAAHNCYMFVSRSSNAIQLADDSGSFGAALTIGSPGTQQNSQCILDAGASSSSGSGSTWMVKPALTFKAAFTGSYSTWMEVYSNGAVDSGWQNRGSWIVSVPITITAASVTPSSGSSVAGASQIFTQVYTDSAGAGDITEFWTFLRPSYAANPTDHACYVHWTKSDNQAYLTKDTWAPSENPFLPPITMGQNGTISNSQCTLDVGGSSVVVSGNNLTVTLKLAFSNAFAGPQQYWLSADNGTQGSGWHQLGTWTVNPASTAGTASFVRLDTTTKGNWLGVYGGEGYNVIADHVSNPAYATPAPSGQSVYVWASTTSDLRGLQKESIANDRIAATWYTNGSETIDLIITDGHSHNIAVYCLDWDTTARQERIDILDGANTVLDSRTVTSFNSGAYLVWTVSGHVQVKVTLTGGANAVISGLFFDPPGIGDFAVTVPQSTQNNFPGSSVAYAVNTTASGGFNGTETFSISGLPAGFSGSFNPATIAGSGSTTLTLNIPLGVAASNLNFTITGTSQPLTHSVAATVGVLNSAPSANSVTPSSGSGGQQTFTFVASDPNGGSNITGEQLLVQSSDTASGGYAYACDFWIDPVARGIYLLGDQVVVNSVTNWGPVVSPGATATRSNSQCTLDASRSSITVSGTTVTTTLALTFAVAFNGTHNVSMELWDGGGIHIPPVGLGTYTVNAVPATIPITITTAPSGLAVTVDNSACTLPCNPTWVVGSSHSIAVSSPIAGTTGIQYLFSNWSDGGTQSHAVAPTVATTYTANFTTQYSLTTATTAGGTISPATGWYNSGAVVAVSASPSSGYLFNGFAGALAGTTSPQNLTMNAPQSVTANFVGAPDFTIGVQPASKEGIGGHTLTYAVSVTAANGFSGTAIFSLPSLPAGFSGTFAPASVTGSGTSTLTLTSPTGITAGTSIPFTVRATAGSLVHDTSAAYIEDSAPSAVSVTPNAGGGAQQTFTFVASDAQGGTDIQGLQLLFASGVGDGYVSACDFWISPLANQINLRNDASTDWGPLAHAGQPGVLQNSQCSVDAGASSIVASGNTLTIALAITFASAYAGTHNISMEVLDQSGLSSGVVQRGTWNVAQPDFTISATPAAASVAAGGSFAYTVNVGSVGGFSGTVTLTAPVLPAGLSATFGQTSIVGSGSTTMTIHVAANTSAQNYAVLVNGASGSVNHSASPTLSVTALPDFVISMSPNSQIAAVGNPVSFTVSVTSTNGFAGNVSFSTFNLPSGAVATFNPSTINTSGSTTMTFVLPSGTPNGNSSLTVIGTSGGLSHSTSATLIANTPAQPDFSITMSPTSVSAVAGGTASYTVNVAAVNGFSGSVALSASGLPAGTQANFTTNPIAGSGATTLSFVIPSGASGSYTITVTGLSGTLNHSASATLTVTAGTQPDYTISVSPGTQTVTVGGSAAYTVSVTGSGGFSGTVSLAAPTGLPSGATYSYSPSSSLGASQSTTLTITAGTVTGTSTITVTGTSGALSHNASATLIVNAAAAPPDFSIGVSGSQTVAPGGNALYTVTVTPINNFSGSVSFTSSQTGSSFNPLTITGSGSTTMTISVPTGTASGTIPVTVTGSSGSLSHPANTSLVVSSQAQLDFSISLSPSTIQTVAPGSSLTYTVTVTSSNGFTSAVSLAAPSLPAGVTANFSPTSVTPSSSGASVSATLTLSVATTGSTAAPYTLTVTGASGTLSHNATAPYTITTPAAPQIKEYIRLGNRVIAIEKH